MAPAGAAESRFFLSEIAGAFGLKGLKRVRRHETGVKVAALPPAELLGQVQPGVKDPSRGPARLCATDPSGPFAWADQRSET